MASYGSGREKQVFARIYHWSKNARNCPAIDHFGGCVFERQRPTADSHRRSSAVPTGYLAGIWGHKALPSQKRQRQTQVSPPQVACGFAGGCGKETSRQPGQFVEGIEQGSVWQKEGNRKAYSKARHWSQDQYLSYGTTQRYYKRPAGSLDKTYSQWLSSGGDAAIFDMTVAGLVQLDKSALLVAGRNACDGVVSDGQGLDCFEIYFVSCSCQRPSTSRVGRAV